MLITTLHPGYTTEMCNKTAFVQVLYYVFIVAFAQIVLTKRTYAITRKNRWVAGILYTISSVQFIAGVYMSIRAAVKPVPILPNPLDSYRICFPNVQEAFTIIQLSLSLVFDFAVFALAVIQNQIMKSRNRGVNRSSILHTVSRDAGIYFALITIAHLLILVMYLAAGPETGRIPLVGTVVFIPMMICRMIMSLKKVASSQLPHTSVELRTGLPPMNLQDIHTPHAADGTPFSVFKNSIPGWNPRGWKPAGSGLALEMHGYSNS